MVYPVATKHEVVSRLKAERLAIKRAGVQRIGLFGSFLSGNPQDESDVDLLVEFAPAQKSFDAYVQLVELLESRLQRPVDLLTRESLSPHIGPRILAEVEYVPLDE
jgi:predicted nucleotidyltransferase